TAWPRCQSVREHGAMSETKIREDICRLGRSLFERGLTPGSSGNISVKLDRSEEHTSELQSHRDLHSFPTRRSSDLMSETKIREDICRLGRSLFERGLTPGSSGNISVKLDDGGWLVTPTNASLGFLDPARLSRLGPDARLISGDAPTKEVPLHSALYQTRDAARAVVHLHSTHSVALSMLPEIDPRVALPPMTVSYLMKCGATALVPYYRPGDPAVADAIRGLAGKYSSVLLANHGPVVSGDTLEAAVFAVEELEETAKLYLLLRGLNPRYLTPAQIADLTKTFGVTLPEHDGHPPPSS